METNSESCPLLLRPSSSLLLLLVLPCSFFLFRSSSFSAFLRLRSSCLRLRFSLLRSPSESLDEMKPSPPPLSRLRLRPPPDREPPSEGPAGGKRERIDFRRDHVTRNVVNESQSVALRILRHISMICYHSSIIS